MSEPAMATSPATPKMFTARERFTIVVNCAKVSKPSATTVYAKYYVKSKLCQLFNPDDRNAVHTECHTKFCEDERNLEYSIVSK